MYLAFNSTIYIHETIPPDNTDMLWIQTLPVSKLVPTTTLIMASDTTVIDDAKQELEIYEFETVPQIRAYSTVSQQWQLIDGAYILVSSDGYVLTDSTGIQLTTKKGR